jgi:ankyrin repeat protein
MQQKTKIIAIILLITVTMVQLHTQDYETYTQCNDVCDNSCCRIRDHAMYDAVTENNTAKLAYLLENITVYNSDALLHYKDIYGNTPLAIAVYNNNDIITEMLMEKGVNVNAQNRAGVTPMHIAAQNKNIEIMDMLLNIYLSNILSTPLADPNIQDKHDRTPLHYAAHHLDRKMIHHIWIHGGDPYITDIQRSSPLDVFHAQQHRK